MRLTTLARKIGITPSQLINFLEKHQIEVTNGLNTKVTDETIAIIYNEFEIRTEEAIKNAPVPVVEPVVTEAAEPVPDPELILAEPPVEQVEAEPVVAVIPPREVRTGTVDDLEAGDALDIEHIKVKKVKLEGIKVIGKIDLPAKPVKSAPAEQPSESEEVRPAKVEPTPKMPRSEYRKPDHRQRPERKTLSYEEKLRQEDIARERDRLKKVQAEKEKKQRFYEKHIAPKTPKKSPKKHPVVDKTVKVKQKPVTYKNPLQRFWAWINGKYDRY